jgi:hypothetical protein
MLQASLFDLVLNIAFARVLCSLHVLFTTFTSLLLSSPQQQQVSHACACDGACLKAAEPVLSASWL